MRSSQVAAALAVALLAGCGSGPTLIPVQGTITRDGAPIEAEVTFTPDPKNPALTEGSATSGADGGYALRSSDGLGVAEGAYVVSIRPAAAAPAGNGEVDPAMAAFGQSAGEPPGQSPGPARPTFDARVTPQDHVFNFNLKAASTK